MGSTSELSSLGRVMVVITMFGGRVGPLTVFVAVATHTQRSSSYGWLGAEGRGEDLMKHKELAVIGLRRWEESLSRTLPQMSAQVLGVACSEDKVNGLVDVLTDTEVADITGEHAMRERGLSNFDVVGVSIGQDAAAGHMITVVLKDAEVEQVIVKVSSDLDGRALAPVGAVRVVLSGHRLIERSASGSRVGKTLRPLDCTTEISMSQSEKGPERLQAMSE